MSRYVRARVPGGTYFFTLCLADRRSTLLADRIDVLRGAYADTISELPVTCEAMVVLPDHLHAVWTLPEGDSDYSERWRQVKYRFTRRLGIKGLRSTSKVRSREAELWQRRFWEHVIRDEADFRRHLAYCWNNPVRHGLVRDAFAWPFSSIHREVRRGLVAPGWEVASAGRFGERIETG